MYRAVIEAARKVEHPMYRHATLYDLWRYHFGYDNEWDSEVPKMKLPGGASDYMFVRILLEYLPFQAFSELLGPASD